MKLHELLNGPLLEGQRLAIYEELLPYLMISEEGEGGETAPGDGTTPPEVTPADPPVQPPGGSGWYRPGPFNRVTSGNNWFNQLYTSLKSLAIATNISKRLKLLGIKGEGARRVKLAASTAAKNVKLLLNNPGATAYHIPVWTTQAPPKPVIRRWNEEFKKEFAKELSKLDEEILTT